MKLSWSALSARIGDKIFDKKKNRTGTVVKTGQSGNYDILYVDFGNKHPTRICPMDDAQRKSNYFTVLED